MSKQVRGVYINNTGVAETVYEHTMENLHELLECRVYTIVERKVGGKKFTFYVDDEGLLAHKPMMAYSVDKKEILFGNIVIIHSDLYGNPKSLSDDDVALILQNVKMIIDYKLGLLRGVVVYTL